jgi:predicted outer membrane repeat protein
MNVSAISTVIFSSNTASGLGGAIYLTGSTATFNGTSITFSSNVAGSSGGAIYAASGSTAIFNAEYLTFNYNVSANGNGTIFADANSYIELTNIIKELRAIKNTANAGGFMYLENAKSEFDAYIEISSNIARTGSGGGLYLKDSKFEF